MHHWIPAFAGMTVVIYTLILENAVNHGGHSEHGGKTRTYMFFSDHPLGGYEEDRKLRLFAVRAVFAVVELLF